MENKELVTLLDKYVEHVQPLLGESPLLFPNRQGGPIDHLSRHVSKLGLKYEIEVPTATDSHTGERGRGIQEREAVAAMMSHSVATQQ